MKYAIILLMLVAAGYAADAQITSVCTPSAALRKLYANDVADMALQRIYELKSPDTILIEIPQRYQDTIMDALAGICNLDTAYQADSVFRYYCVHRYRTFMGPLAVKIDPAISWVVNWRRLEIRTGNADLDNFLERYQIDLQDYWYDPQNSLSLRDWAYLSSTHPINWKTFGDSLQRFQGFGGYEFERQYGDGDAIYYSVDSVQRFRFIAGRGDCPAGCTEYKMWKYSISKDCSARLDGIEERRGYNNWHMPNCNLKPVSIAFQQVITPGTNRVYPNPARTTLKIVNPYLSTRYKIYDVLGRQQLSGIYAKEGIDVSQLARGCYIILFTSSIYRDISTQTFNVE